MRTAPDSDEALRDGISVTSWQDGEEGEDEHEDELPGISATAGLNLDSESTDGDSDSATRLGRRHPFFQRSDSTIFMGCPPPDPFHTPLVEALPLADQPHLLQPNARREDYFGMAKPTVISKHGEGTSITLAQQLPLSLALSTHPEDDRSQLARSLKNAAFQPISAAPLGSSNLASSSRAAPASQPLPVSSSRNSVTTEHLRSSDIFPQSVAVNLSLSASNAASLSHDHIENTASIPLPMDSSGRSAHLPQASSMRGPEPSPSSGVLVGTSTAFLISHPSQSTSSPAPAPTPSQLARAALSAFSEIATGRERMSTSSSSTSTTTTASIMAGGSSNSSQAMGTSLMPTYHLQVRDMAGQSVDSSQTSVIMHTASTSTLVSLASPVVSSSHSRPSQSYGPRSSLPGGSSSCSSGTEAQNEGDDPNQGLLPKLHFAFLAWNQASSSGGNSASAGSSTMTAPSQGKILAKF